MTAISIIADKSEANSHSEAETFQWMQQWYPVAVIEFLDATKPHAFQLLGKNVVLWRDGNQQWRCFVDACPHRLAPLSEGRVEANGILLCAYHAWRFDGDGNCAKIPQSQTPAIEAQHRANPKSCAIAYPTQSAQGLLWVWAESGEKGAIESKNRAPRLIPELDEKSDQVVKLFWNIRDMPYGWDYFMENVADPAHVPVSHHGIVGDRYRDAKYYDMPRLREISTQEGFSFGVSQGDEVSVVGTKDRWLSAVYTPNPQDKMIITFRQWLEYRAGGGVDWDDGCDSDLPPVERDKRVLFDVWHTHTVYCQYCQTALQRLRWARAGSYGLAIVVLTIAILLESQSIALSYQTNLISIAFVGRVSIGLGLTALGYGIHKLIELFYVYEFEHAHND